MIRHMKIGGRVQDIKALERKVLDGRAHDSKAPEGSQ